MRNSKVERIQHELVTASLKLLHTVRFVDKVTTVSKYPPFLSQELYIHGSEGAQYDAPKTLPLTVDIGCGGGYSLKPLIAMGYPCIGVDLDLSSLQQTKIDLLSPKFRNHLRSKAISVNIQPDLDTISTSPLRNKLNALSPAADVVRWDLRRGLPFKQNSFDLAISISFLQWLFYGNPKDQLDRFFATLKSVLCPNGRAILQFYPQNRKQLEEAVERAMPYFRGVVLGDYPHLDRGRKLFLILFPFHPQEV
ncbi:hypothetical protein EGW08_006694 [Elysia chlorotica]|uniref:Methyltransferase type 11 domain-containing protein n=1 Tax=Elysia chlorotica TaxID=188477 RepID=A0A3S1HT37_ELYCH|nr:hypothetical protein EGW08_006694 [Elysia chlorotica]